MRHRKHQSKLAVAPSHRKSLVRNLCISLIGNGTIKTTHAKAKAARPVVEKLVTLAKVDTVANRRLAFSRLNSVSAVKRLFAHIAPRFEKRPGGYTRIVKLAEPRVGDNAKMSCLQFVDVVFDDTPSEEKASPEPVEAPSA